MRWLFLLLLVMNAGYLAWELDREHIQHAAPHKLPVGVERIVLLSELESATVEKQDVAQLSTRTNVPEPVTKPLADDSTPPQQTGDSKTQTEAAALDTGVAVEESAAVAVKQDAVLAEDPVTGPADEPAGDLCYTLGPFREMKTLRLVTREIRDYVVEASFRSREEQEQSMFRVLLTPVGSKQEAKAMIKELVSKNIRDYFIISEGPSKNGISLGYFSSKGRAHRHADRVRKHGFDVVVEPVFKSYTIYWLDYRIKAGDEIPQQIVDEHLENSAQRLSRDCA